MAKSDKKLAGIDLKISLVDWTPSKVVDGETLEQVNRDGSKVLIKLFIVKLPVLGKMNEFTVYPKERTEKDILLDFFSLKKTNELPIKVIDSSFKNDRGEVIQNYSVVCKFDDIHQVVLKPADRDRGRWNMAIQEIIHNYQLPEEYAKIRKANYEAAVANKAKKDSSKVSDDLPF